MLSNQHGFAHQADIVDASELISTKTLTLSKLVGVMPPGTPDPSPFIYDSTMYALAGFMSVAALSHYFVRAVDPKHFEVLPKSDGKLA